LAALGALAAAAAAVSAYPAAAQQPPAAAPAKPAQPSRAPIFGAGSGPIDISADELEVINSENRAVWKGNVEAIQGTNRLRTPLLNVYFAKSNGAAANTSGGSSSGGLGAGFGSIQRMEADGPVYYVTPTQNARGDHATYEAGSNQIVMTGNVVLVQDKNVVQGDRLTIDTVTNHTTLVSNSPARSGKRVRGVFYQAQNAQPQQQQTAKP
jgi:lipopolysaccharide export system protein LptA